MVAPGWVVTAAHVLAAAGLDVVSVGSALADGVPEVAGNRDEGRSVRLRRGVSAEGAGLVGQVAHVDVVLDVALLQVEAAGWRADPPVLVGAGELERGEALTMTGLSGRPDPSGGPRPVAASTTGSFDGWEGREDGVVLMSVRASGAQPGMSGAPVLRASDDAVVGMVTSRYNSSNGWGRDTVWVVGAAALAASCERLLEVVVTDRLAPTESVRAVLRLGPGDMVSLSCPGLGIEATESTGPERMLFGPMDELRLAQARRRGTHRGQTPPAGMPTPLLAALEAVGAAMGEVFLPGSVGDAMNRIMTAAESQTVGVELALDLSGRPDLRGLRWEAMHLPRSGVPVALHYLVTFYRKATRDPAPREIDGPLKIVVAIASPISGGGGALDYQSELRAVHAAVQQARTSGRAEVRIVPFATTKEIKNALSAGDVHVLHVSGHGAPGVLVLEDEKGCARRVTAREFVEKAIPAGTMPPLICLAACETNVPQDNEDGTFTSFADGLVAAGAPVVIATEDAVADRYATEVFAQVYGELAQAASPDPVEALARARRQAWQTCRDSTNPWVSAEEVVAGWSVVTVQAPTSEARLFDPATVRPRLNLPGSPAARTFGGLPALDPGRFV